MNESRRNISLFLEKFKRNAKISNGIKFRERKERKIVLEYYHYTDKNLEEIIMDLVPGQCTENPKRDKKGKGIVCVFQKWESYPQREIYIRLIIPSDDSQKWAICQSFKFTEFPS